MAGSAVVSRHQELPAFRLAQNLAVEVHTMALRQPHAEQGEAAQAIRRVACAAVANIAASADRPRGRLAVVRSLVDAQAACDEACVHVDLLHDTGALDDTQHRHLYDGYLALGTLLATLAATARACGQAALWMTLRRSP
jgi:four helix bundle protein